MQSQKHIWLYYRKILTLKGVIYFCEWPNLATRLTCYHMLQFRIFYLLSCMEAFIALN